MEWFFLSLATWLELGVAALPVSGRGGGLSQLCALLGGRGVGHMVERGSGTEAPFCSLVILADDAACSWAFLMPLSSAFTRL